MLPIETRHVVSIAAIPVILSLCSLLFVGFQHVYRNIPGPFIAKFSPVWRLPLVWSGATHEKYRELHAKYGPIVQIAPNVLAISDPAVIATIYGISSKFLKVFWL
jgi:hypothetical protein